MNMISIKYCDIPTWLQAGDFYRSLSPNKPEESVDIPTECFRGGNDWTADNNNEHDFSQLVRITLFWKLDEAPVGILEYCIRHDVEVWRTAMLSVPGAEESKTLKDSVLFENIVKNGTLELILHTARLLENRCEATAIAAEEGNFHALKHLRENGFAWHDDTCWRASMSGHLDCLQYARENGCPWDKQTTNKAALAGQPATLRYAMEQGCPFGDTLLQLAARSSNFECLQYLLEVQGLGLDRKVFGAALLRGNLQCLQYLIEHGCPYRNIAYSDTKPHTEMYDQVFVKDNPEFTQCVRYAVERGWDVDFVFSKYVSTRDAECTAYLKREGLFVDIISIKYCDIPDWLHAGEFFRNLNADDPDDIIEIPADCYAVDYWSVTPSRFDHELRKLVKTMLFWMLDEIPRQILDICADQDTNEWHEIILSVPGAEESTTLLRLCEVYPFHDSISFSTIIATGQLELIAHAARHWRDQSVPIDIAAREGNLRVLQHLHEQGLGWTGQVCGEASKNGHLDCVKFALANGCPGRWKVGEFAAANGHLHILEYAFEQEFTWSYNVCWHAATNGHLSCLQYAHEHGGCLDSSCVLSAAGKGHLACLQYLLQHGCPLHNSAANLACQNDYLDCLQLLHDYGALVDEKTCAHAAACSNVYCLQYLYEFGCPWDKRTTVTAAVWRKLAPLQYALEHGCQYNDSLVLIAALSGSIECLQYLVENQGLFMDENVFKAALVLGNLACLQYLIDQGCPYLDAVFAEDLKQVKQCINNIHEFTQCVQYAVERGWKVNKTFCEYVNSRYTECTAYLKSEGLFIESMWNETYTAWGVGN